MRKIILQEWLSMDGYAADSNNGVSFLESTTLNKYSDADVLQLMDGIDTILPGPTPVNYLLISGHWPLLNRR